MTTVILIAAWVAVIAAIAWVHDWAVRRRRRGELLAWAARTGVDLTGMTRDECDRMSDHLQAFTDAGHDPDVIGTKVAARQQQLSRYLVECEQLERESS